jgi:hypothetical protein
MIADFAGMLPIRDPILLPDNNAQLAENCWLYRGQIRGFRAAAPVAMAQYADTQQVYRIPLNTDNPPDFTSAGSLWLEFPDPFITAIRNPTVGDTYNRYYFFPSDQYNSKGDNPAWPTASPGPVYNTLTRLQSNSPMYSLGIDAPTTPPTITPPASYVVLTTNAPSGVGATVLYFAANTLGSVGVGMYAVDLTDHRLVASTTIGAAINTTTLTFSSTGSAPNNIIPGMACVCTNNPATVFPNSKVASVTATTVTLNYALVGAVNAGDTFQFDNANQIITNTTVTAVNNAAGQVTLSTGVTSGGVQTGDTIQFLTAVPETRAYVYTFISDFDEESQPSPATVASGDGTGTWIVVIPAPPAGYNTNVPFNPGHYRLYRTVTDTAGNATYYQVTEVPINPTGTVTISDSASDASITANLVLSTIGYAPPPAGLQGVVMMANGIAAGFTNEREIWFSAAYLPHAWPPQYALTVDYPVVGLTADGTSLNIITQGSPFIATGVTPDTMTIGKVSANEPCISRGSIVGSGEGAYYASPNGVQLLNSGGTTNVTEQVYEKEFHYSLLPPQWASARYGSSYASFIKGAPIPSRDYLLRDTDIPSPHDTLGYSGFVMDSGDANTPFTYLRTPTIATTKVLNAYSDELSGQIFILQSDNQVLQWNPPVGSPGATTLRSWQWKTKKFRFTMPQQFKAFMVIFEVPPEVQVTLGVRNTDQAQVFDPTSQYMIIRVYANGNQIVVREVQAPGEVLLIPGGFKAEIWEFQFEGQIGMRFFKVASSVKELKAT